MTESRSRSGPDKDGISGISYETAQRSYDVVLKLGSPWFGEPARGGIFVHSCLSAPLAAYLPAKMHIVSE